MYWNPLLETDAETGTTTVSFATDLQGKYRITIEGVGQHGKPIRVLPLLRLIKKLLV